MLIAITIDEPLNYLHNGLLDFRMRGHAQVVVGAPDRDLLTVDVQLGGERRIVRASCDLLEDTVRVVLLLLHDLLHEESRILEA